MNKNFWKSVGTMILPSLVATALVQACISADDAAAQTAADPIEGPWAEQLTLTNCQSGAVLATIRGLDLFHRGGTYSSASTQAPTAAGPTVGTWTAQAGGYTNVLSFFRFNPDGSFAGTTKVRRTITLQSGNDSFTFTSTSEVRDPNGVVLVMTCGTGSATRA